MQKIDFFGGLHGNFLELVINVAINGVGYDITKPQFTPDGACHLKNKDSDYVKIMDAKQWSFFQIPFLEDDVVIRIIPTADDMLIGLTNSYLRAGDEKFDIDNLEIDTIKKLSTLQKGIPFQNYLIKEHGIKANYPRGVIRKYFYGLFQDHNYGLGMFTNFDHANKVHHFPFRSFFDLGQFYHELNNIAYFLDLNFYPTPDLARLHNDFIKLNQGYHSEVKMKKIWHSILYGHSCNIQLNLIEEAWINHQIAVAFRCYDLPLLAEDQFPVNTLEISHAIYQWKSQDY